MILSDVMDQVATRLTTIEGLRVTAHPPDEIQAPAAVVTYPDRYEYDQTYARGMDRIQVPVIVLVGKVSTRSARDQLSAYVNGSGTRSVKAILEANPQGYTAFHTLVVVSVVFDVIAVGPIEYLAATFTLDITGPGA